MKHLALFTVSLPALLLIGCAGDQNAGAVDEHAHDDLVSRAELERLENEIGKLEFRLFELENQTAPVSSNSTAEPLPPVVDETGNFDLTPVD